MEPGRARLCRPDLCFCCSSHHSHWEVLENGGGRFEWMVFNGERGRNSRRRLWCCNDTGGREWGRTQSPGAFRGIQSVRARSESWI